MTIYKNNFDTSTTGTNIEFTGCYDSFTSRMTWEDNFTAIAENVYFYTDYGNLAISIDGDISFKIKGTVSEKRRFLNEDSSYELIPIKYLDNVIKSRLSPNLEKFYFSKHNPFEGYKLEIVPSTPLESVVIRGYNQGDYATVYYAASMLKKLWGKAPDKAELIKEFKNYFYDSPISATLTINGSDYYYDLDPYNWQRTQWLAIVSLASGVASDTLEKIVPSELAYI